MSSTFTPEDILVLDKTQKMRERLADVIMAKPDTELPRKPAELMAVTNLLESIDRSVLGRTKMRIDDDNSKNDAANKEILKALIMQMHQNGGNLHPPGEIVTLQQTAEAPVYTPSERPVQAGELILKNDIPELPENLR